jgi:hypothetical protein
MLYSKQQQARNYSRNKGQTYQPAKSIHKTSVAGEAIGMAGIVSSVVGSLDRRKPDEIKDNYSQRDCRECRPPRRDAFGVRFGRRDCSCVTGCLAHGWSLTRTIPIRRLDACLACNHDHSSAYSKASGARKGITGKSGAKPARSRHCD